MWWVFAISVIVELLQGFIGEEAKSSIGNDADDGRSDSTIESKWSAIFKGRPQYVIESSIPAVHEQGNYIMMLASLPVGNHDT